MTQRNLDTTVFTERGALTARTYTGRTISTSTYTQRGEVTHTDIIPPGEIVDDTGPTISNVHCNVLATNSVVIDWDTDEEANCNIRYDTRSVWTTYTEVGTHEHFITNNRVYVISGLTPDTTYYFRPVSEDMYGNGTIGSLYSFKTADTGKPGEPPEQVEE